MGDAAASSKLSVMSTRCPQHADDALAPHGHGCPVAQRLMRASAVVKADPGGDAGTRLAAVGVALQIDVLVLQRPPQPFDEDA